MQIRRLRHDGSYGIVGQVINVPVDVFISPATHLQGSEIQGKESFLFRTNHIRTSLSAKYPYVFLVSLYKLHRKTQLGKQDEDEIFASA
jgi:hypothetical protein